MVRSVGTLGIAIDSFSVMAGLVPAIHALLDRKDVDARQQGRA
jgi:hypothetical protein